MRCCATPTPRCIAPSSWAATSTGSTAGELPGEIGSRSRALPGAVPRAHRGGGARLGGRCRLRAGARPGREARRRQRLRKRRCTASSPGARRHGCGRCRAGRRHLVPFLSDDEHRRARHHRSAPGSVRPYSRSRAGVFRSHPHRRGDFAPDQRHHAAAAGDRLRPFHVCAQSPDDDGRRRDAVRRQLEAGPAGAARRAGDPRPDPAARPARAAALPQQPGPGGRRLRLRRRVGARDTHGAGVRARGRRSPQLCAPRRGGVPRRRGAHPAEGLADLFGDADRLLRGGHHSLDRRARRARGAHHGRGAGGVRCLWVGGGGGGGPRARGGGRAERGSGLGGGLDGVARCAWADRRTVGARSACPAHPWGGGVRPRALRLSGTPGDRGIGTLFAARRARRAPGAGGSVRGWKVDGFCAAAAVLRSAARCGAHRRHRYPQDGPGSAAAPRCGGAPGAGDLRRQRARQRELCAPGGEARGSRRGMREGIRPGIHRASAARARHGAWRARRDAFRRAAPAAVHRPGAARRPADPAARRGHQLARCGERAHGPAGAGGGRKRPPGAWPRAPAGLGNTAILVAALENDAIDVYPEYTGTISNEILRTEERLQLAEINRRLARLGLAASTPLGFSNSYALGTRRDLRAISDLTRLPELRLGFSHEFLGRGDGWPGLKAAYGLPQQPRGLDHGLAYEALAAGEIDVMDLYSTDAKIERYRIAVLADDRGYFPAYDAVLLHRADAPVRYPQAFAAFARLQNSIDSRTMVRLNARAELDKVSFGEVAREYLGGGPASKRTLRAALFAPDSGRLLAEHLGLVFGSLVVAALIGVPLGVLAAKVGWLAQPVLALTGLGQTIPSLALLAFPIPLTGRAALVPAPIAW